MPEEQVTQARPFAVTGVDYTGVIYVKNGAGEITKVYTALYTCAVTRAIHLKLVENNTVGEFLHAFRRYVARRSIPNVIISDNAKTFEAADRTLQSILEHGDVHEFCDGLNIRWKFIIKRAPWTGGFYKRLIGLAMFGILYL